MSEIIDAVHPPTAERKSGVVAPSAKAELDDADQEVRPSARASAADRHVGNRIRERRVMLGLSQQREALIVQARDFDPVDRNRAGGRSIQPGQNMHQRGFTGT